MLTSPQTVIDRARSIGYVSSNQYTDTIALEDYNIVRQILSNYIMTSVNELFFGETVTTDAVISQNEYTLTDDANSVKINKISDVWLKAVTGEEYVKLEKIDQDGPINFDTYSGTPVYYIKNDSVFIYPAVDATVTGGLKVNVYLTPTDLLIAGTDSLFPREYKNVIALGMIPLIYQRRGLINESNNAKQVFEKAKMEMVMELSDRVNVPETYTEPNLDYYE